MPTITFTILFGVVVKCCFVVECRFAMKCRCAMLRRYLASICEPSTAVYTYLIGMAGALDAIQHLYKQP